MDILTLNTSDINLVGNMIFTEVMKFKWSIKDANPAWLVSF
jgi:hypothetical protein